MISELNTDEGYYLDLKAAGKLAAETIIMLKGLLENERNLKKLDKLAGEYIMDNNGVCTFLNYKGFPRNICISRNEELVHGVAKDIEARDGDIITFDLGVTINESIADTASTYSVGECSEEINKIIKVGKLCLSEAISSISVGKRIGSIGYTINKVARKHGYKVINDYGGHFISRNKAHCQPFIGNKGEINEGIRLQNGATLAIEPLLVIGEDEKTRVDIEDKWTVYTKGISVHEEHTIYVIDNRVEIITKRSDEL